MSFSDDGQAGRQLVRMCVCVCMCTLVCSVLLPLPAVCHCGVPVMVRVLLSYSLVHCPLSLPFISLCVTITTEVSNVLFFTKRSKLKTHFKVKVTIIENIPREMFLQRFRNYPANQVYLYQT